MALALLWAVLLHRYSAQDGLVLGLLDLRCESAAAGRVVRCEMDAGTTWAGL